MLHTQTRQHFPCVWFLHMYFIAKETVSLLFPSVLHLFSFFSLSVSLCGGFLLANVMLQTDTAQSNNNALGEILLYVELSKWYGVVKVEKNMVWWRWIGDKDAEKGSHPGYFSDYGQKRRDLNK